MTERFETVDDFLRAVREQYEALPEQLQAIAKHVELNRDHMIVTRITDIARACGVQPSAVTRFSQRFGLSGFSELQVLFRNAFSTSANPSVNYAKRVQSLVQSGRIKMDAGGVLRRVLLANHGANEEFAGRVDDRSLRAAVELLRDADQIYVVGVRRSHAAACYLTYWLQHLSKPIHLINGFGGTFAGQMRSISRSDLLVVVCLTPYARETRNCVRVGASRGAKILAITDTGMGPVARAANVRLLVNEASVGSFRSLTNTLCLCQALFIALATRLQLGVDSGRCPEMDAAETVRSQRVLVPECNVESLTNRDQLRRGRPRRDPQGDRRAKRTPPAAAAAGDRLPDQGDADLVPLGHHHPAELDRGEPLLAADNTGSLR